MALSRNIGLSVARNLGSSSGSNRESLADLRERSRDLEILHRQVGAPAIPQDSPGFFRRIIDVLSRFEFAEAGFVEEFFQGRGLGASLARAGREFFSGIGSLEGEKRGFGEVLERLHVPDFGRLSNIIPGAKEFAGGFFDITGRGVGGLMLSIVADPLTYLSRAGKGAATIGSKFSETFRRGSQMVTTALGDTLRVNRRGLDEVTRRTMETLNVVPEGVTKSVPVRGAKGRFTGAERVGVAGNLKLGRITDTVTSKAIVDQAKSDSILQLEGALNASLRKAGFQGDVLSKVTDAFTRGDFSIFLAEGKAATAMRKVIKATHRADLDDIKHLVDLNVTRRQAQMTRDFLKPGSKLFAAGELAARMEAEKAVVALAAKHPEWLAKKGLLFMGRQVPGTAQMSTLMSGVSTSMLKTLATWEKANPTGAAGLALSAVTRSRAAWDSLGSMAGKVFEFGHDTKSFMGFNVMNVLHRTSRGAMYTKQSEELIAGIERPLRAAYRKKHDRTVAGVRIIQAVDQGTVNALTGADRQIAEFIKQSNDAWFIAEARAGLLKDIDEINPNYIAHLYENSAEEVQQVMKAYGKAHSRKYDIGRIAEERAFDTFDDAVEWSKHAHELTDGKIPVLRPVEDPLLLMQRRGADHIDNITLQELYLAVGREWGTPIPTSLRDLLEHTRDESTSVDLLNKIDDILSDGKLIKPRAVIEGLTDDGKREFFRRAFMLAKSRDDVNAILKNYDEFTDFWPKGASLLDQLSPGGTPYGEFTLKSLANMNVPKEIIDDLSGAGKEFFDNPATSTFLRNYDRLQASWKQWMTIYFPAFTFRNYYANIGQAFNEIGLAALDPRYFKQVVRILGKSKYKDDLAYKFSTGESYTLGSIRGEIEDLGITTTVINDVETGLRARHKPYFEPFKGKGRAIAAGANLKVENSARVSLYMKLRNRGVSKNEAAQKVRDTLFQYDQLTRTEKAFFRRVFPFYTWTRKNIELQVRTLATNPGRVLNQVRPFRGRDEENQSMVQWRGESLKIRLDSDGNTVRMLNGIDLPIRALDIIWKGSLSKTFSGLIGIISPLMKAPIEIAAGKNLFTGRNLSRKENFAIGKAVEKMPAPIKDWMGWRRRYVEGRGPVYSFDGERFYLLFQSFRMSRLVSTTDRQFRNYLQDDNWASSLLDLVTNLRLEDTNFSQEQIRKLRERIPQLERSIERRGVGGQFRRFFPFKERGQIR